MAYLAVPYISSSLTFCMFIDPVETGFCVYALVFFPVSPLRGDTFKT